MGQVIDTTQSDFSQDVIRRSHTEPVVVDFWAPWCGPCRMLGPLLERLAHEPDSGFTLAKVNVDLHPGLSQQYGVRGIPAVKAFVDGQIVADFVGAQPEPRVRAFIADVKRHVQQAPSSSSGDPQQQLQEARRLLAHGRGEQARALLQQLPAQQQEPLQPLVNFLCGTGDFSANGSNDTAQLRQQVINGLRSREPAGALYALLMLKQASSPAAARRLAEVARAIIDLYPDNSMAQSYRAQFDK